MFFKNINSKMEKVIKSLGCEIRGIDLKTENRPESINHFLIFIIVNYYFYLKIS